jgi:hypothetical protein
VTGRDALRRLAQGTGVIGRELAWAGEWRETIARWVLFALAAAIALSTVVLHPWLAPAPAVLWFVAASVAAPEEDEGDEDGGEGFDPAVFLELVHDVAGGENVHLVAVREQLAEETGREWSGPQARALCAAAGIPVRDGVRVPGASPAVTTGIHRDDLPPLPRPSSGSPVDDVAAGEDANNNTNDTTVTEVGQAAVIVTHGPSIRQAVRR